VGAWPFGWGAFAIWSASLLTRVAAARHHLEPFEVLRVDHLQQIVFSATSDSSLRVRACLRLARCPDATCSTARPQ